MVKLLSRHWASEYFKLDEICQNFMKYMYKTVKKELKSQSNIQT